MKTHFSVSSMLDFFLSKYKERNIVFLCGNNLPIERLKKFEELKLEASRHFVIKENQQEIYSEKTAAVVVYGEFYFLQKIKKEAIKNKRPTILIFKTIADFLKMPTCDFGSSHLLCLEFLDLNFHSFKDALLCVGEGIALVDRESFSSIYFASNLKKEISTLKTTIEKVLFSYRALDRENSEENLADFIFSMWEYKRAFDEACSNSLSEAAAATQIYLDGQENAAELHSTLILVFQIMLCTLGVSFITSKAYKKVGIQNHKERLMFRLENGVSRELNISSTVAVSMLIKTEEHIRLRKEEMLNLSKQLFLECKKDNKELTNKITRLCEKRLMKSISMAPELSSFNLLAIMRNLGHLEF